MKSTVKCFIFDYYKTLANDNYFNLPEEYDSKISESLYRNENFKELLDDWWIGKINSNDIVNHLSKELLLSPKFLLDNLKFQARNMKLNRSVFRFSKQVRSKGYFTAIATINSDIFNSDVIPGLELNKYFDCIINSFDYKIAEKHILCKIAMDKIDKNLNYNDCLLIDDTEENVNKFISMGGKGYRYTNDEEFEKWLKDKNI
ncbi:MAG TPA: hypothetical protein PK771_09265 [Spirochaetota bacterium]|nr:hypothetical protein [Spirochaetota bacterium]